MAIFKSVLAGLAGMFVAAILGLVGMLVQVSFWAKFHHIEGSVGWDPISLFHALTPWLVLAAGFVVSFAWEYRRATRGGVSQESATGSTS